MMHTSRKPFETRPARIGTLARLPVFLSLDGRRAVVAGGNAAAAWKAELLAAAGARVDVFAAGISEELRALIADPPNGTVIWRWREWTSDDLAGAALAVGAFDDDAEAAAFAGAARACGVPVNVIDKPSFCDFSFGAIVNRSPLVVGISTDGAAPVFAQAIRAKLEALLPKGFSRWTRAAARWRSAIQASGLSASGQREFWRRFTAQALANPDTDPVPGVLDGLVAEVNGHRTGVENGSVTLVGAGPGDPELLTLRAVRALQAADVILFDDRVSREVLDFARREARRMLVGKDGLGSSGRRYEINALMVALAKQGRRVVRLTFGDPIGSGNAEQEIAACRAAGIACEVVPGIIAGLGAAEKRAVFPADRARRSRRQVVNGIARKACS